MHSVVCLFVVFCTIFFGNKMNTKMVELAGAKNIEYKVMGPQLTIVVDLTQEFGPTGSGKSTVIASSCGEKPICTAGTTLGLNFFRQREQKACAPSNGEIKTPACMKGITLRLGGNSLLIDADLGSTCGRSGSGKTALMATTNGNILLPELNATLWVNVYHPRAAAAPATRKPSPDKAGKRKKEQKKEDGDDNETPAAKRGRKK
eukprot:TRINITY_DN8090_c0_g1_i2.p2 TRINITY_DN8090_c0_g1~~TRINITY_DN8090_c0_g1_i2.p2  ORF type:complete len:204 (+),score=54.49 TRINITY_DN8090_c0_g1_i2:308-919(+)